MSGGGGPSSSTVTQTNIPEYLQPAVETMVGGGMQELFTTATDPKTGEVYITGSKPYVPYSTNPADYVAGFSPLQQQVQYNAANLQVPGQYNQATGLANMAGMGGMQSAQQALGYGNAGFQSGQLGQQLGIQGGQYYGNMGAQAGLQGQQSGLLGQQVGMQGGQYYGGMGAGYGNQAAMLAPQAQGYGAQGANYGNMAAQIGQMGLEAQGLGRGITAQSQDLAARQAAAGQNYQQMMTDPNAVAAYMNPYAQNVIDIQSEAARRQAAISGENLKSQAARSGAYGGARQYIQEAEADRALQSNLANIQAQGLQNAYNQAIQNMQYGSNLGLQGLAGAQSGLGTALQGGQLGLSGIGTALQGMQGGMQGAGVGLQGLSGANQLYQTGIQGAGLGLQGVGQQLAGTAQGMQGAQAAMQGAGVGLSGVDRQLAGTAQGMQGAQTGLQGVQGAQAGYGLANTAANSLANIGTQQLGAQTGILELQNSIGATQQQQQQNIINQAIQNFVNQQQAPVQNLATLNALIRGLPMTNTTQTQYQATNPISTLAGLGLAGAGMYNTATGKKRGGKIQESDGIDKLALADALKG